MTKNTQAAVMSLIQQGFFMDLNLWLALNKITLSNFLALAWLHTKQVKAEKAKDASKFPIMTQVARKMRHSTPAATGFVDHMEDLGLLERRHPIGNCRKVIPCLTLKGVKVVGEGLRNFSRRVRRFKSD